MTDLASKHCEACTASTPKVPNAEVDRLLKSLNGYAASSDYKQISKTYSFENYYETMAFVNAVAFIAHREDHHPDLVVSYNKCRVEYGTHAIGGLSENDFICVAKIEAALK